MSVGIGVWWPQRRLMGGLAVLVAALTGTGMAILDGGEGHLRGGALYTLTAVLGLAYPPAIAAQVIVGQAMAATLLLGPEAPPLVTLLPAVVGVVATAELLALSARLGSPVERSPGPDLRRSLAATAIGAAVFGAVLLAGALPGPSGLAAVTLAAAALTGLAVVLVGRA